MRDRVREALAESSLLEEPRLKRLFPNMRMSFSLPYMIAHKGDAQEKRSAIRGRSCGPTWGGLSSVFKDADRMTKADWGQLILLVEVSALTNY
jgi:hypothetical protein